eukprot:Nitzschia sp. Nitz4//scaffold18_size181773//51358//52482//NITZ4_001907-RA/size181773-processed-gene-0.226-mRNA-1//-1//CDS//3329539987//4251//frame0
MQHQGNLTSLGLARLQLFRVFFLRSLQYQTTDNFLLVVRTDPNLSKELKLGLQEVLEEARFPRYLLLASNENPRHSQYEYFWETNHLVHNSEAYAVWGGNLTAAMEYMDYGASLHILETRLDADDGLQRRYLEVLQHHYIDFLSGLPTTNTSLQENSPPSIPWKLWCAGRYVEWQYDIPKSWKGNDTSVGSLFSLQFSGCITAGLTIGYTPHQHPLTFPSVSIQNHESLVSTVPSCQPRHKKKREPLQQHCIGFLSLNPSVWRARTPTSAGMLNVFWSGPGASKIAALRKKDNLFQQYNKGASKQWKHQDNLWKVVELEFATSKQHIQPLRRYMNDHIVDMIQDNLSGQCTAGHSCKNTSSNMLQLLLEELTTT